MVRSLLWLWFFLSMLVADMRLGFDQVNMMQSNASMLLYPSRLASQVEGAKGDAVSLEGSMAMDQKSFDFLQSLHRANGESETLSSLMADYVGESLKSSSLSSLVVMNLYDSYYWFMGVYHQMDAHFMTHSGFGSLGALESEVMEQQLLLAILSTQKKGVDYSFSLKVAKESLTQHNYGIGELIDQGSLWDYFENRYTKKEILYGADFGISYPFELGGFSSTLGGSLLTLDDQHMENIALWSQKDQFSLALEYRDIGREADFGIRLAHLFFEGALEGSLGWVSQEITLGVGYRYGAMRMDVTYDRRQRFQLSMALQW